MRRSSTRSTSAHRCQSPQARVAAVEMADMVEGPGRRAGKVSPRPSAFDAASPGGSGRDRSSAAAPEDRIDGARRPEPESAAVLREPRTAPLVRMLADAPVLDAPEADALALAVDPSLIEIGSMRASDVP